MKKRVHQITLRDDQPDLPPSVVWVNDTGAYIDQETVAGARYCKIERGELDTETGEFTPDTFPPYHSWVETTPELIGEYGRGDLRLIDRIARWFRRG